MAYFKCVAALAIASFAFTSAQQFQQFADYDYADSFQIQQQQQPDPRLPPIRQQQQRRPAPPQQQRRPEPGRGNLPPQRETVAERTTAKPIAILEQINEHNEDGSYTYGYKAEDGSFKLETRYPDGRVIGKYGYIDIDTGKVKVIEYGADMMGFQPEGDFPEGIIIPPPVNGTDDDYDYVDPAIDVDDRRLPQANAAPGFDNNPQGFRVSANRARGGTATPSRRPPPSQNRGQDIAAPVTERSRTRFSQQAVQQVDRFPPPQQEARFPPQQEQEPSRFSNFGQQQQQPPARFDPQQVQQTIQAQRSQAPVAAPAPPPNFQGQDFQTNFDQQLQQQPRRLQQQARPTQPPPPPPQQFREPQRQAEPVRQSSPQFRNFGAQRTSRPESPRSLEQEPPRQNSFRQREKAVLNAGRGRARRPVSRGRTPAAAADPQANAEPPRSRRPSSQRIRARPTQASPLLNASPSSPATEDPLEVLRSLQQGSAPSRRPTPSSRPAPTRQQSALDAVRGGAAPTSSSQFSSFPIRGGGGEPGRSRPPAEPRRPLTPTPATPEPPRAQPVRIRPRPQATEAPVRLPAFVPTPQTPQANSNRFLARPAVPSRSPDPQTQVDFDALISEFTGRQTPRPTGAQFAAFSPRTPTPSAAVPQFAPTPAVPSAFNSAATPTAQAQHPGPSFQLITQLGSTA